MNFELLLFFIFRTFPSLFVCTTDCICCNNMDVFKKRLSNSVHRCPHLYDPSRLSPLYDGRLFHLAFECGRFCLLTCTDTVTSYKLIQFKHYPLRCLESDVKMALQIAKKKSPPDEWLLVIHLQHQTGSPVAFDIQCPG